MKKVKIKVGMDTGAIGVVQEEVYTIELPKHYTDKQIEEVFQGYYDNFLDNLCYDPDSLTQNPFGGWEVKYD